MNRCFPCFGDAIHTDTEREPLLPKSHAPSERLSESSVKGERSVVDKIVDVLAALNAGKLPTQDQLSHFLQILLRSELLKEDKRKVTSGHGPLSQEGRKTFGDIRGLVQAFLQFGLEKNADDRFQQLYFQVVQIERESAESRIYAASHAAQRVVEETSKGAGHVKDLTSIQSQVAFDAATLLHAMRTLSGTCLKSPSFRLILTDTLSIAREVIAHAVADVGHAASQVQEAAADVQQQVETTDDIIDRVVNASVDDAKNKGKEAVDNITEAAKQATEELKNELQDLGEQAGETAKEKLLQRMQEVIARLQKDPASRGAMHAILHLARKYAEIIADAARRSEDIIIDIAAQAKENDASNYPPHPYEAPKTPFIDATSDILLENIKDVLQRLAQGHSLDNLISTFGRVVRDLDTIPSLVEEGVEKNVEEKIPESPASEIPPPSPVTQQSTAAPTKKGKGKRHKKARLREEKKAQEKQTRLSPAASTSQLTTSSREDSSAQQNRQGENQIRTFFPRLGAYLDKALDEPNWAMSNDGASSLEGLFNDGYELFSAVGEAAAEVVEEVVAEDGAPTFSATEELSASEQSRRQIKADLSSLIDELEAFTTALKNDKMTMNLVDSFDALGVDLSSLLSQGVKQGWRGNLASLGSWTSWVGWAIPRLLRLLPHDVVPIPTIEVKTESIEAAVHALFVQGLSRGSTDPVATSLIPDEVVVKEWTEVRIDMAENDDGHVGLSNPGSKPGVQSTSRVRMHTDGVRAKVEGMGYYFKYTGGLIGYEDEGILSIDVGTGGLHEGLGADIEIEIESDNIPFEPETQIPEIVVVDEDSEAETENTANTNSNMSSSAVEPLFRVVDVQVAMSDVRCRIDKSRHWILNKLFLEHLAGPVVARMAKLAMEERIRAGLDVVSKGLGAVLKDAREKGELRRSEQAEEEKTEESLTEILSDWWSAILNTGPLLFGRDQVTESDEANAQVDVEHRTKNTATSRGVIHTSTTTTTEQPRGTPAMVYNFVTDNLEEVNLPVQAIGGVPKVQEDETVVAVGNGPQLFPGKGGAYGATDNGDNRGVVERIQDTAEEVAEAAVDGLQEASEQVTQVEERWHQKVDEERQSTKTWKSKAFDF